MTLLGHDVSKYQQGLDVGRLGARFIIAKTAQAAGGKYGTSKDPAYAQHKANARRAGKHFGTYFYVGAGLSAAANAALHASVEPDRTIPVMLDWEEGSGSVPFLRAVAAEFGKLGYRVNLTYAPRWYWQQQGSASLAGLAPLCSSRYPDNNPGSVIAEYASTPASYWNGYGGLDVAVLQFSSAGRDPAYPNTNLDCLAFNGTEAQLAALFSAGGSSTVGTAPDQEEDDMDTAYGAGTGSDDPFVELHAPINGRRYLRVVSTYNNVFTIDGISMIDDTPGGEGSNGRTVQQGGIVAPDRPGPWDLSKADAGYANYSHVVIRGRAPKGAKVSAWVNDRA